METNTVYLALGVYDNLYDYKNKYGWAMAENDKLSVNLETTEQELREAVQKIGQLEEALEESKAESSRWYDRWWELKKKDEANADNK